MMSVRENSKRNLSWTVLISGRSRMSQKMTLLSKWEVTMAKGDRGWLVMEDIDMLGSDMLFTN